MSAPTGWADGCGDWHAGGEFDLAQSAGHAAATCARKQPSDKINCHISHGIMVVRLTFSAKVCLG
ncbi:MAG: hypothetical protein EOO68_08465 [Moraxellaceae bacterium]|nr:MAG: hypothetical protein EOO68_08465 [Moraxellaceae bacterium]